MFYSECGGRSIGQLVALAVVFGLLPATVAAQGADVTEPERPLTVLQLDAERLQPISLHVAGQDGSYFYLPYDLKNNGDEPVPLALEISAVTDRGETLVDSHQPGLLPHIRRKVKVGPDGKLWTREDLSLPAVSEDMSWQEWSRKMREAGPGGAGRPTLAPGTSIRCVAVFPRWRPGTRSVTLRIRGLIPEPDLEDVRLGSSPDTNWDPLTPPKPVDETPVNKGAIDENKRKRADLERQYQASKEPHKKMVQVRVLELAYRLPPEAPYARVEAFELEDRRWRHEIKLIPTDDQ